MPQDSQVLEPTGSTAYPRTITVVASKRGLGWDLAMEEDENPVSELVFEKKDKMHGSDWHLLTFELHDPRGELMFHPLAADAIWIARGTDKAAPPCPSVRCSDPSNELRDPQITAEGNGLTIRNDNPRKCKFSFRLNFVRRRDEQLRIVASLDPIISNKNGGV